MKRYGRAAMIGVAAPMLVGAAAPARYDGAPVDRFLAGSMMTARDPAAVAARCAAAEALAGRLRRALEARTGPASMAEDFRRFDDLTELVGDAAAEGNNLSSLAVDKPVRDAGQVCTERMAAVATDIGLSRPIHDRLAAIPTRGLDTAAAYVLGRALLQMRLGGVDRPPAVRAAVAAQQKRVTEAALAFDRAISEDALAVGFTSAAELAGLPGDWLDAHPVGKDGRIRVTTSYPDAIPVFTFADREDTRRAMMTAFDNRAWPANEANLTRLIAERATLARLLGRPDFASLNLADKMAGTSARVRGFLAEIDAASRAPAGRDIAQLLARYRRIDPAKGTVDDWSRSYLARLVRRDAYDVDQAEVRRYFTLAKVRAGIFGLARDLFGADIRPRDAAVWAPGVTAWSLYDGQGAGARLVGHFYLDLSPREGKFSHAAQFTLRTGSTGRQVPVAGLMTNFPAAGPMEHGDVVTFLHEFGHLLHTLYGGHHRHYAESSNSLAWDFIEAPSQMLEEWAWDYPTLRTFATDEAGKPIPAALVGRMDRARAFTQGLRWRYQLGLSAVSLGFYDRAPGFPLRPTYDELVGRYYPIARTPGTHAYASFGHLSGYGAGYYTYIWSKAIASDLFTRFRAAGLRDRATAMAYRRAILEAGGTGSADALVRDFLGRDWSTAAFKKELEATP